MAQAPTTATDVVLAGDILRVATDGLPTLTARNTQDALSELRDKHQPFRDFLNLPPNGHANINSCLLYPPFTSETDGTLFLASRFAYAPFAGTALMAAATVLAQTHDQTRFRLDTALGPKEVSLTRHGKTVTHANWFTDPPTILKASAEIPIPNSKPAQVSLINAGLPYVVANLEPLGLRLTDYENLSILAKCLSQNAAVHYPLSRFDINDTYDRYLVMFISKHSDTHIKTLWVSDSGEVANSAGGTGALAVLAACESTGTLPNGQITTIEAPGGAFTCQIADGQASVTSPVKIFAKHRFPHPLKNPST